MNKFKFNKIKILVIIFILIFLICMIFIATETNFISNVFKFDIKKESEEILPLFSYAVYDNSDEQKIKVLINVNSENGIEYVEYPDGKKLYGNGKNKIAIDYLTEENINNEFKIKEISKEEISEIININNDTTQETTLKMERIAQTTGYQTIQITPKLNIDGYTTSYQIGVNGEWQEGSGKISFLDYDVTTSDLINTDDNTVTITAKIENKKNGDIVKISTNYDVDTTSTISSFNADGLIQAMEKYDFGTGKYKVKIENETYNLKVYSFDEDLEIQSYTAFGTEEDVATSTEYAKNMIVLKVNGDLTINRGATLSTYSGTYGGPKGFLIYCSGTLTNNGMIDMSGKGAKASGEKVYLWKNANGTYEYVPAVGAAGGAKNTGYSTGGAGKKGKNGQGGIGNRTTGGGGSGGIECSQGDQSATAKAGESGTSYCGGAGSNADGIHISAAGNKYGGGLLILSSNEFINNGGIYSDGSTGVGKGNVSGGSSGGGSINVFGNVITKNGSITANGGPRLSNKFSGGAGGNGSISVGQIVDGTYVSTYTNY